MYCSLYWESAYKYEVEIADDLIFFVSVKIFLYYLLVDSKHAGKIALLISISSGEDV